jgi:pantothenate kinase
MSRRADVVKVGIDDLDFIALENHSIGVRRLLDGRANVVLHTDGSRVVHVHSAAGGFEVPVRRVQVADPIGAGDAFGGGFAAWWDQSGLGRQDLNDQDALRAAVAVEVAAVSCTRVGARPAATWRTERHVEPHSFVIELSVDEAIGRAAVLAAAGRTLLGIAGCPGAGKSTLSAAIAARVPSSTVVPMDGFHLLNDDLVRLGRRGRKGAPDTFDVDGYVALLDRLRRQSAGEVIAAPRYDRAASAPIPDAIVVNSDIALVITEGNYLLLDDSPWMAVRPLLDEVWFVDDGDKARVQRLLARHIEFGKSPDDAREWVMRSDEANAAVVAASRGRADAVVRLS